MKKIAARLLRSALIIFFSPQPVFADRASADTAIGSIPGIVGTYWTEHGYYVGVYNDGSPESVYQSMAYAVCGALKKHGAEGVIVRIVDAAALSADKLENLASTSCF